MLPIYPYQSSLVSEGLGCGDVYGVGRRKTGQGKMITVASPCLGWVAVLRQQLHNNPVSQVDRAEATASPLIFLSFF